MVQTFLKIRELRFQTYNESFSNFSQKHSRFTCRVQKCSVRITFSTPTIEGTVLTRNKADASGKHPWKAEVTEGDTGVSADTIKNWYSSVYEPVITATEEG